MGIAHGFSNERNIKIQILIGLIVIILALILNLPKYDFILILIVSFVVIMLELVNVAIERLIDEISPSYDIKYGRIKDIMAGVVLLAVILSIIVGLLVFVKPIINLF